MKYKISNMIRQGEEKRSPLLKMTDRKGRQISSRVLASDRGVSFTRQDSETLGRHFRTDMVRSSLQPVNIMWYEENIPSELVYTNPEQYARRVVSYFSTNFSPNQSDWTKFVNNDLYTFVLSKYSAMNRLLDTYSDSFRTLVSSREFAKLVNECATFIANWMRKNTNPNDPFLLMKYYQQLTRKKGLFPAKRGQTDTSFIFYEYAACQQPLLSPNITDIVINQSSQGYIFTHFMNMVMKIAFTKAIKDNDWKKEIQLDEYTSIIFSLKPYDYLSAVNATIDDYSLFNLFYSNTIHVRPHIKFITANDDHFREQVLRKSDISFKYYQEQYHRDFFRGNVLQTAIGYKLPFLQLVLKTVSGQVLRYTLSANYYNEYETGRTERIFTADTGAGFRYTEQKYNKYYENPASGSSPTKTFFDVDYTYDTNFVFYSEDSGNTYGQTLQVKQTGTSWNTIVLTNGYMNKPDNTPEISSGLIPTISRITPTLWTHRTGAGTIEYANESYRIFNLISNIQVNDTQDQFVASLSFIPEYDPTSNSFSLTLDADNVKEYDAVYVLGQKI